MANIWEDFDQDYSVEEIENNVKGQFKEAIELPEGKHEVAPNRINFIVNKKGNPMAIMNFEVIAGELEGEEFTIFQNVHTNQTTAMLINFLQSMDPEGKRIEFEKFSKFVSDAEEAFNSYVIDCEYIINKFRNKNDFDEYKIEEIFELE